MKLSAEELTALTRYQIGALKAFLDAEDVPLHHVKVRRFSLEIIHRLVIQLTLFPSPMVCFTA